MLKSNFLFPCSEASIFAQDLAFANCQQKNYTKENRSLHLLLRTRHPRIRFLRSQQELQNRLRLLPHQTQIRFQKWMQIQMCYYLLRMQSQFDFHQTLVWIQTLNLHQKHQSLGPLQEMLFDQRLLQSDCLEMPTQDWNQSY